MTDPTVTIIDVHELKKRQTLEPHLCLIDVREPDEWEEARIPGALHIPKDTLPACIETEVPERHKAIYLYCKGGVRSLHAGQYLIAMGYQEVYSIDGGIIEWAMSGYPVEV
ncbi:TPA: rhodanese-like domain-containing protein [Legionella feeleii]|uniref:Rhodanese domain protein n=1 Tax=Legionella feeleii TaxID=453 RepID=A0A378IR86_9GAMM|nr:rhodanese-like domain-containing protein [Legionella feeleii]STX37727.1 Rhodanese domain protein [Legionella feeleii]